MPIAQEKKTVRSNYQLRWEKVDAKRINRTFKEANSLKPISTESMLSIFPSPDKSLKSRTSLLLLSESSPPDPYLYPESKM